jgi:hypothetical protein
MYKSGIQQHHPPPVASAFASYLYYYPQAQRQGEHAVIPTPYFRSIPPRQITSSAPTKPARRQARFGVRATYGVLYSSNTDDYPILTRSRYRQGVKI